MQYKKLLAKSPLHKLSLDIKAKWELLKFSSIDDRITGHRTTYCISPYKTATRYLNGCYRDAVSAHEPLHYLSLRELNNNFDEFFIKRLNTLNLKLECSGFFSAYVEELSNHPLGKDLQYIVILRPPSCWITSVVNFWNLEVKPNIHFPYPNRYFWMEKVGVNLDLLFNDSNKDNEEGIRKLESFYMDFTKKTSLLKNVHYVNIGEIDSFLPFLDELIQEESKPQESSIKPTKEKSFDYKNEELDREYDLLVMELCKMQRSNSKDPFK